MNKLDRQRKINENLKKIKTYKKDINCCKFSRANTIEHELKKAEICIKLNQEGIDFVTEAIFENGRCDVFVPECDLIYEIIGTESKDRFESKKYPVKKVIPIFVDKEIKVPGVMTDLNGEEYRLFKVGKGWKE